MFHVPAHKAVVNAPAQVAIPSSDAERANRQPELRDKLSTRVQNFSSTTIYDFPDGSRLTTHYTGYSYVES